MAVRDIKLTGEDLLLENGDFSISESDATHIEHLLISEPGNWREHPLAGMRLRSYLNAPETAVTRDALRNEILIQLRADGFTVRTVNIPSYSKMIIDAEIQ